MHLKKLNISGFKSFADPVSLEFSDGISAIVGPNGSGKSNITDAIKWVLGEQSIKSLRGKKMEDVIFSGTEKKSPSGLAQVVLILDNTDESLEGYPAEISISRKLFRSGESDYAINKRRCKLKDIYSIFMDTGLGKNGYSLISQGGIENIIASSPIELRGIFEEAVGIVAYKTKKQEAEKKLEQTQENLNRLLDIREEIEKQLGPLKNQSRKAKLWLTLYESLKMVDLVLFYEKATEVRKEIKEFQEAYQEHLEFCETNEKNLEEKDASYQKLILDNREIDRLLGGTKERVTQLKNDFQNAQKEEIRCKSQEEANRMTLGRLKTEGELLAQEIEITKEKIKALTHASKKTEALIQEGLKVKKNLESQEMALRFEEEQEKIKEKKHQASILLSQEQRRSLEEKLLALRTKNEEIKAQENFKNQRQEILEKELNQIKTVIFSLKKRIEEIKQGKLKNEEAYREQALIFKEKAQEQEKKRQEVHLTSNNIQVGLSKIDYLKNIQKNYQDYFPAIRKLMTSEKILGTALKKVHGPLGELISMESRYVQAIDVALGAKIQNIVVEDVQTASDCIDLLKTQHLGRATFLPLDNLRYTVLDERTKNQLKNLSGFEGIASELIQTSDPFKKAVDSLLGRSIVAKDFNTGKNIQKITRQTVVTLAGEIFYPGGAIVGGQNKESKHSPLFKKKEIENLEAELKSLKECLAEKKKSIEDEEVCLKKMQENLKALEKKQAVWKQTLWEETKALESSIKKQTEAKIEAETLENQGISLEKTGEKIRKEIKETEIMYEDSHLETKILEPEKKTDAIRQCLEKILLKISENQMEITRWEGELQSLKQQSHLLNDQLDQQNHRKSGMAEEAGNLLKATEDLKKREALLSEATKRLTKALEVHQDKNRSALDLQKENKNHLETLLEEIKKANHDLIELNDKKNQLEIKINNLQVKTDHWEETIYESYEMNYIMVQDCYEALLKKQEEENLVCSKTEQAALKAKILALGNVNVESIKEYEEVLERHTFMKKQMDDLDLGKHELLEVINSFYEAMSQQFKEKFRTLQEKFTQIFGILFEGGRAYLEFTDPNGVLEGGIELVAQPPGKRLRHISLLSGGEKSMVAIALLFSFLEINPAPFCVIDEIDAALDDHNIYRYISYLKKISTRNQFITITHRRKTLEVCHNLYGVSMSRDGVSQLVSVRLSDYQ